MGIDHGSWYTASGCSHVQGCHENQTFVRSSLGHGAQLQMWPDVSTWPHLGGHALHRVAGHAQLPPVPLAPDAPHQTAYLPCAKAHMT